MVGLVGLVELLLICAAVGYQVVYSFNCGSQTAVKTPMLHFDSDQMYEGLASKSHKKSSLPAKYKDNEDLQLFSYERTTDGDIFSYFLPLTGPDHYFLLLKFIEVVHEKPKQRVFEVKLGDEVMFEVDIVREVGVGEVLNKWVHFQLIDDILYVNQTMPVLNGYIYPKQTMQVSLAKIVGLPKIEALTLFKGADAETFIRDHIELETLRFNKREELVTQKYQKDCALPYKQLTGKEFLDIPEYSPTYYLTRLFSLDTLFAVAAVVFVILHEKIYDRLNIPRQEMKQD